MPNFFPWSDYIIRKGVLLALTLAVSALLLSVYSSACPSAFLHLRRYIACFQNSSATVLAASLFGGLLLEDLLRRTAQ